MPRGPIVVRGKVEVKQKGEGEEGGVMVTWKTRLARHLAGVRKRDAHYSSRRAPRATRGLGRPSLDARSWSLPRPPSLEKESGFGGSSSG